MLVGIFFYWGNLGCLFFGCGDGQIFWELQLGMGIVELNFCKLG